MRLKIAIAVLVLFTGVSVFYTNVSSKAEISAAVLSTNTESIINNEASISEIEKVSTEMVVTIKENQILVEEIAEAAASIPEPVEEESEPEIIEEVIEEQIEEPEQESSYSDEIMTIASVVEAETKGQDMDAKIHIVHVIRNRVNHSKFPNDYYSVCTANNQFASRWDIEQSTIDAVVQGLSMEDTTNGALFFCLCKESCWLNGTSYSYLFTDSAGHHFWG
jgi:hypothetical protein